MCSRDYVRHVVLGLDYVITQRPDLLGDLDLPVQDFRVVVTIAVVCVKPRLYA